jgi:hypothetical protein
MPAFHPLEKFSLSLCILLGVCYGCIICSIDFLQRRYLMADISSSCCPCAFCGFLFSKKICSFSGLLLVGETKNGFTMHSVWRWLDLHPQYPLLSGPGG